MKTLLLTAAATVLSCGLTFAQPGYNPNTGGSMTGPAMTGGAMSDANVAAMIKAINDGEVRASQSATKKSQSPEVKRFAKMMVRDHTQNNQQLASVSKRIGLQPAETEEITALKDHAKSAVESLEGQSGGEFDRAYIDQMVKDHEDALRRLDSALEASVGRNEQLNEQIKKTRQAVSRHLDQAKSIQSQLSGSQTREGRQNNPVGNE